MCHVSPCFACTYPCSDHNLVSAGGNSVFRLHDELADTMRRLLDLMYGKEYPELTLKQVVALFKASDKYEVARVYKECVEGLKQHLNVFTLRDMQILAERHDCQELLQVCSESIGSI